MSTKQGPPVTFRGQVVEAALTARTEEGAPLGQTAKRDLERYYALLGRELATVSLSEAEASLIIDVCNGTLFEPHTAPLLWAEIANGIRLEGADQKWGVDGDALVAKLRGLTVGQAFAVIDAVERFWTGPYREMDHAAALRKVGLIR